jgi:hypothetical protein
MMDAAHLQWQDRRGPKEGAAPCWQYSLDQKGPGMMSAAREVSSVVSWKGGQARGILYRSASSFELTSCSMAGEGWQRKGQRKQ